MSRYSSRDPCWAGSASCPSGWNPSIVQIFSINMSRRRFISENLLVTITLLLFSLSGLGQNLQLQTKNANLFPTVIFALARSGQNPPNYSIAVDSTGNATYQSFPSSEERTGVPYSVEFVASAATRSTIFRLTEHLHFFKGLFGMANHAPKNASIKTLTFREGKPDNLAADNQITYISSGNAMIRQLTSLFEGISSTLEFGRRLTSLHRQHNNGIDIELKHMERMTKQGQLRELQAVAPVLSEIESDMTLDKVARQRAMAILKCSSPPYP